MKAAAHVSQSDHLGIAFVAVLLGIGGGYRLGAGSWTAHRIATPVAHGDARKNQRGCAHGALLEGPRRQGGLLADPKKTSDGRDYLPVYDEEEAAAGRVASGGSKREGKGKLLYYRNPMGLADTSPVPKKDWMGMDYIAVYEGEEDDGSTVKVSLDKVQRAGVRTEAAAMRRLVRPIRAPGHRQAGRAHAAASIALRADGFIEKLYVNETGQHVKKGEPLFRIYSPDMVKVQVDYRIVDARSRPAMRDEQGRRCRRLRESRSCPEPVLDELKRTREPVMSIDWPSPVSGVVMQKKVIEGQMVKAGDELLRLADLSNIWVIADVAEQDIGSDSASVRRPRSPSAPSRTRPSRAASPSSCTSSRCATRTAKVRIEVDNPDHRIKHEMFADVEIDAGDGEPSGWPFRSRPSSTAATARSSSSSAAKAASSRAP